MKSRGLRWRSMSSAVVCCWSYIYPFGNCQAREGPIELNNLFRISQMSKGSVTGLLFTFSSFMTLLFYSVNLQSEIYKNQVYLFRSHCHQFTLFAGYFFLIIQPLPLKVILVFVVILQSFSLFLLATEIQTYSSSSSGRFENAPGDICAILLSNRNLQNKLF